MLDKARNNLIKHAFQLAGITCPESEPTAAEIDDAAHTLNVMLQSWNNDGFRLFKIKRGYMPFIKGTNEYSLANQAYKSFSRANVNYFNRIGATNIVLESIANAAPRQKLIVVNNVVSSQATIKNVNYADGSVDLLSPIDVSIFKNDAVFYGSSFASCTTNLKTETSVFNTLNFKNQTIMPAIGDTIYFKYGSSWQSAKISLVDADAQTITLNHSLSAGSITSAFIIYGSNINFFRSLKDYPLSYKSIELTRASDDAVSLAIKKDNTVNNFIDIDYIDGDTVITKEPLNEVELRELGVTFLKADEVSNPETQASWVDLLNVVPPTTLDWGSITDSSSLQTDDYGRIIDPATTLLDWGTLTSSVSIKSFASTFNDEKKYLVAQDSQNNNNFLFYKTAGAAWTVIDVSSYNLTDFRLVPFSGEVYLYDSTRGVFKIENDMTLTQIYSATGAASVVQYKNFYYFISPIVSGNTRQITCTTDFVNFDTAWTVDLPTIDFPAIFDDKLYIGSTQTFVTNDMRSFSDISVYSEGRCVVGDRILNLNYTRYCSFSKDGVNFSPMPLMFSTQSAWGYKDGCSFVAVYGILMDDGTVGTEIYTTNDFNPVWLPKMRISGRVTDIFFNNSKAYFVSDIEVKSLTCYDSVEAEDVEVYLFGEKIGRPQEIMNVMKYSLDTTMQLPMNALALKDFLLLPNEKTNGEPVNYCFMREAEDGKMMVWGTPNKFGEYLRFSYVEPLTLLEDARSTPDFPDEYYEAVEDGLAAELAYHYHLPLDRIQTLVAKATASKENAMLHDNEDASYDVMPNQRML